MNRGALPASTPIWVEPPRDVALVPGDVHVWRVMLTTGPTDVARLVMTLDAGERARAGRLRMRRDRDRFVISHAVLRAILGGYLACDPARVRFDVGTSGKPKLADPREDIRFNLSHSDTLALVAVARGREVGVDVERVRDDLATPRVADMFFAPSDAAAMHALPPAERTAAFFGLWTCAEAFMKALGSGHTGDRFHVPCFGVPPVGASIDSDGSIIADESDRPAADWPIVTLVPGAHHMGAIAVQGTGWRLRCWAWTLNDRGAAQGFVSGPPAPRSHSRLPPSGSGARDAGLRG